MTVGLASLQLERPLGRGGMGEVWLARHEPTGAELAVKLITTHLALDPAVRDAFVREVHAVAGLDHPGIVVVHDHGVVDDATARVHDLTPGGPYLVMERAHGHLGAWTPGDFETLRRTLMPLLDALAHAHARGVIHRDLKPGNVLVLDRGLVLSDFGIARVLEQEPGDSGANVSGTPDFMAPEQARGDVRMQGPWTDLYALGCLAFTLAAGTPPFRRDGAAATLVAQISEPVPPLVPLLDVPDGFVEWLERALAKDPRQRFQRAADAAHALAELRAPARASSSRAHAVELEVPTVWGLADTLAQTLSPSRMPTLGLPPSIAGPRDAAAPPRAPGAPPPFPAAPGEPPPSAARSIPGLGLGLYGLRQVPLVGRDVERERLWSALGEVSATSRPRAVVVRGPSGAGKSRLVGWLGQRADELGAATVVAARHEPGGGPAHGLGPMLARRLRAHGMTREVAATQLARSLDDPRLARELSVFVTEPHLLPGPARASVARAAVEALAADRPLIVWLDDVQWSEEAVHWVAGCLRAARAPLLFVLCAQAEALAERPMERAALDALDADTIELGPLDEAAHRDLVDHLLGLGSALREEVVRRTTGNALFAVQLVGDWVQRSVLVPVADGFALREGAEARVPDDIHELWMRRRDDALGGLTVGEREAARRALAAAAALGVDVDEREWRAVCAALGEPPDLALETRLEGHGLVRRRDEGFSLAHGMLQESLERDTRERGEHAAIHGACADVVARLSPHVWTAHRRRGRHLARAGDPVAAFDAIAEALQAMPGADLARGREQFEELERLEGELAEEGRPVRAARIAALDARAFMVQERFAEAAERLDGVDLACLDPDWRGRARLTLALSRLRVGALDEARATLDALQRDVALLLPRTAASIEFGFAELALARERWDASAGHYARAIELLEDAGEGHSLGHAINGYANALARGGRFVEADAARERARAAHAALEDAYGLGCCAFDQGEALLLRGRFRDAVTLFRESREHLARIDSLGRFDAALGEIRALRRMEDPAADELGRALREQLGDAGEADRLERLDAILNA